MLLVRCFSFVLVCLLFVVFFLEYVGTILYSREYSMYVLGGESGKRAGKPGRYIFEVW